jgi:thiamine pyrophosphokinase
MRAIIFANGVLSHPHQIQSLVEADDYIIAADGGTHHALQIGIVPNVIIGDLDSLAPADKAQIENAGGEIIPFSPRKDETDLELALRHAVEKGATDIVLIAALGGRVDQTVANLFLLSLPELAGRNVSIVEGNQTIFLIRDTSSITGSPGDTVSILPIGGDAVGVSNQGFEWPLRDETLPSGSSRGVSNVLRRHQAQISVREGMLLCVVSKGTEFL